MSTAIILVGTLSKTQSCHCRSLVIQEECPANKQSQRTFQTLPPSMLVRRGVKRDVFPVGQTVTISGFAAKDGTQAFGWMKKVTFADGKILQVTAESEEK